MKKLSLLLLIIPFLGFGQTTHYYDWGYNKANQQINIELGDTVEWTWVGGGNHNLISTSGIESFNSGYGGAGKTFSYTFNSEGSTNYVCTPHSGNMYGTVNVSNSLSLSPDINNKHIKIYPNPTNEILNFYQRGDLMLFNSRGQLILQTKAEYFLDVSMLERGMYFVLLQTETRLLKTKLMLR